MKSSEPEKTAGMRSFIGSKKGIAILSVLAVALIVMGTLVLLMSRNPEYEPLRLTWNEFIGHYDTDGDGFVDDYTPNGFLPGESVIIEDVALDVEYDADRGYSIISCESTFARSVFEIPMIAYGNMESWKGREFTYRMTFWEYDHYSSLSGHRIEILPKELAEIIEPDVRVSFAVYRVSEGKWSIQVFPDEALNPKIMKYALIDVNGTTVFGSAFPQISGVMDSNGVLWDDVNDDGVFDDGDRIEIDNENIASDHIFSIVYGASGSAPLP